MMTATLGEPTSRRHADPAVTTRSPRRGHPSSPRRDHITNRTRSISTHTWPVSPGCFSAHAITCGGTQPYRIALRGSHIASPSSRSCTLGSTIESRAAARRPLRARPRPSSHTSRPVRRGEGQAGTADDVGHGGLAGIGQAHHGRLVPRGRRVRRTVAATP